MTITERKELVDFVCWAANESRRNYVRILRKRTYTSQALKDMAKELSENDDARAKKLIAIFWKLSRFIRPAKFEDPEEGTL